MLTEFPLLSPPLPRAKVSWAHNSYSDCIAMLNAYQEWIRRKTTGQFRNRKMVRGKRQHGEGGLGGFVTLYVMRFIGSLLNRK